MTVSDWTEILVGAVLILQGWQQNRIFERQNKIIAGQAGDAMPEKSSHNWLRNYWPTLANLLLALSIFLAVAYDRLGPKRHIGAIAVAVPWTIVLILALISIYFWKRQGRQPSSALLSPLQSQILQLIRDLRKLRNDAGPAPELQNTAPMKTGEDPKAWTAQMLSDSTVWTGEYAEWARKLVYRFRRDFAGRVKEVANALGATTGMVVAPLEPYTSDVRPGDDFQQLLNLLSNFVIQLEIAESERQDSLKAEAKRAAMAAALPPMQESLFTPLQVELFQLAKELRQFLDGIGPCPTVDKAAYGYDFEQNRFPDSTKQVHAYHDAQQAAEAPWRQRLHFGYIQRFSSRIRDLMLRVGEAGYPIFNPDFAETVSDENALLKLAADLDMMALHLYSPKKVFGKDWPVVKRQ